MQQYEWTQRALCWVKETGHKRSQICMIPFIWEPIQDLYLEQKFSGGRKSQQMLLRQLGIHMQRNEVEPLTYTIYVNLLKVYHRQDLHTMA